ncbi:hypothetical protein TB2_018518 [Malus domestica]
MQSLTEILAASQGMKQPTCAIFGVTGIAEKSSNSTAFSAFAGVWFLCEVRREGSPEGWDQTPCSSSSYPGSSPPYS